MNKANISDTEAHVLDLHLSVANGFESHHGNISVWNLTPSNLYLYSKIEV